MDATTNRVILDTILAHITQWSTLILANIYISKVLSKRQCLWSGLFFTLMYIVVTLLVYSSTEAEIPRFLGLFGE